MSWSGGGLAAKLKAEKEAADQAQVALAKAEAECRQTYGCGLRQHITNAVKSAVVTPEAVASERSWEGAQWTNSPAHDPHSNPSIDKYHKLEDQAKAAARAGNLPLAVQRLEDANATQEAYESNQFDSANSSHAASSTFRLARRNSLGRIHRNIIDADPGVAQAKMEVGQITAKYGITLPGIG